MNAIRVKMQIESETLRLPQLKPLVGANVEIIVLETGPVRRKIERLGCPEKQIVVVRLAAFRRGFGRTKRTMGLNKRWNNGGGRMCRENFQNEPACGGYVCLLVYFQRRYASANLSSASRRRGTVFEFHERGGIVPVVHFSRMGREADRGLKIANQRLFHFGL